MGERFTYTASAAHRFPFGQPCPPTATAGPGEDVRAAVQDILARYVALPGTLAERIADAALAAVRPSPDSEAVARVEALAEELHGLAEMNDDSVRASRLGSAHGARLTGLRDAYRDAAARIRAALGTGDGWIATTETCARCAALGTGDREGADRG